MARGVDFRQIVRNRLSDEVGRIDRTAPHPIALAYPSAYRVAMSSLGYQTIYRLVQQSGRLSAVRIFAPDDALPWGQGPADLSYETFEPLNAFPLIAFSIAYELELGSLLGMLARASIPLLREERNDSHPVVLAGGPLTSSNPRPLEPFFDAIVIGEADAIAVDVLETAYGPGTRQRRLEALARCPSVWVPSLQPKQMPQPATCPNESLPAWAPIRTPHTELRNMFLVEAVRGCSRRCHYCVVRGRRERGMRIVDHDRIMALVPEDATRVGLVGASVSDHPGIVGIVSELVSRNMGVGLSSLRPERLKLPFVQALRQGGYKTITTAMDGASQRLRDRIERGTTAEHLINAVQTCREAKIGRVKLYLMVGLPTETEQDLDEAIALLRELSRLLPISVGVSAFCAKPGTPLQDAPFAGIDVVERHIKHLRRGVAGKVEIRATSSRWAWVEHVLASGGREEGLAVKQAEQAGGSFAHYRKAFENLGHRTQSKESR